MRSQVLNDDVAAAMRRAVAFAAMFGMAGLASIACTARTPDMASIHATDRLLAEEARLTAQLSGGDAIAFPQTLLARRADPHVVRALAEARRRFDADRRAALAQQDAMVARIEETKARRDLYEAQRTVARLKLDTAMAARAEAERRHDRAAFAVADAQIRVSQADEKKATVAATAASGDVGVLTRRIAGLVQASRARASQQLAQVQARLRGG